MIFNYKYILVSLFLFSKIISQETEFTSFSGEFVIDTKEPEIELLGPNVGDVYLYQTNINVRWATIENSPALNPVTITLLPSASAEEIVLVSNLEDNQYFNFLAPGGINSSNVLIKIDVIDSYGNISTNYNSGYFTIGIPYDDDITQDNLVFTTFNEEYLSTTIIIDTKDPELELLEPNAGDVYQYGDNIDVRWTTSEDSPTLSPITITLLPNIDEPEIGIVSNLEDNEYYNFSAPENINSSNVLIKLDIVDHYGNAFTAYNDGYFTIGNASDDNLVTTTFYEEFLSSNFIIDTKPPEFNSISHEEYSSSLTDVGYSPSQINSMVNNINEDIYSFPNGSEILSDYTSVPLQFSVIDDSDDNANISVRLAYLLGGWYIPIANNIPFEPEAACIVDMSLNGLVEPSIWARVIFRATDDYGNVTDKYNNDYFVLGDSEGDLDINWVDEDSDEIMINWAWESKHAIMITKHAIEDHLLPGDSITLVDNSGIVSDSCDDSYGYTELRDITINDNGRTGGPKSVLRGINHCENGGLRRPGFIQGNPIILKITHISDASFYYVYPNTETVVGSSTYNPGGHTVIRDIDFDNPITIDNHNHQNQISSNGRDFDSFNVYYKVNAANLRDCGTVQAGNNDSDGDGTSDPNWCYDTTILGETDYLTQVPTMTQSSILTYRVWLMNNTQQEVFKTVDTEISIEVELSDIYDKSLSSGWNWFSLNISNSDMSVSNILSSLNSTMVESDYIKSQSAFSDYLDGFGWFGTLQSLDNLNTYKIKLTNSGNITYEGSQVNVNDTPIELSSGWNWISYLPQESININTAFQSIDNFSEGDYIKNQSSFSDYIEGFGFFGTLENLNPRGGYLLKVANEATLVYPESGSLMTTETFNTLNKLSSENYFDVDYTGFEYNGTMIARTNLNEIEISENDEIGVFYNGECRGVAKPIISPIDNELIFYLMFYSNEENEELDFIFYDSQNNKEINLTNKISFIPDMHLGEISNPYMLNEEEVYSYFLSSAYPNPFNPSTTIGYSLADNVDNMQINIFDIRGRLIQNLYNGDNVKGQHKIIWNATKYASGVYFVNMLVNNHVYNEKIMLVK